MTGSLYNRMWQHVLAEVQNGKGFEVIKTPFEKLVQHGDVKIDCVDEFEACMQSVINSISDDEWSALFEHGIINKYGHAITYEFSENVDKVPNRFMYLLKKPVQPDSTKLLIDDTPISKLFAFGEALVKEIFGDDFKLDKISILLSEADARDQVRHIDYKGRIPTDGDMDYALIMPFKFRASMALWPFSQFFVRATEQALNKGMDSNRMYSFVRDKINSNPECKINFDSCERKSVFFGTDEMLIIGENTVHGGDKNTMSVDAFRAHFYITHKSRKAPNNKTIVLENLVWDATRKGAQSIDVRYRNIETFEEYKEIRKATQAASKMDVQEAEARSNAPNKSGFSKPVAEECVSDTGNIGVKRGRPRKQKVEGRGRPRKNP